MNDPWTDDLGPGNPTLGLGLGKTGDDPTGGGYSSGYNFINPATGQVDPNYRPPAGTTDRLGQTGSPSGGRAGGGGPGGAGAPGGAAATTTSAPVAGAAASTYLGMTVPQWLNSALALYGAYRSSQPGKFQQIPESPLQTAARQKLLGFVDNSPTRDLLGNLIGQRLGAAHPFELPNGAGGYNPYPAGNAPSYDLSAILPMLTPHAGATPPASTGASPVSGSVDQWLTAHPEIMSMGVNTAAGAVAAQFRIPQDQALQIVTAHVQGQQAPPAQAPAMIGATP